MALAGSLGRLGATYLAMGRQRLELAALDIEEELLRASYLLAGLFACVALGALALAAGAAAIVIVCWETSRVAAAVGVALFFLAAAAAVGLRVQTALRDKPAFLSATLTELRKDAETFASR